MAIDTYLMLGSLLPDLPQQAAHPGYFEIEDYSFGGQTAVSFAATSLTGGAARPVYQPFSFTWKQQAASVSLLRYMNNGKTFGPLKLALWRSAGQVVGGVNYCTIESSLVRVSSWSFAHDDEAPKETWSLELRDFKITYSIQKADGSLQAPAVITSYDRATGIVT